MYIYRGTVRVLYVQQIDLFVLNIYNFKIPSKNPILIIHEAEFIRNEVTIYCFS